MAKFVEVTIKSSDGEYTRETTRRWENYKHSHIAQLIAHCMMANDLTHDSQCAGFVAELAVAFMQEGPMHYDETPDEMWAGLVSLAKSIIERNKREGIA